MNKLLNRNWSIIGKVIKGQRRGRKIGFPTCNLKLSDYVVPKLGVYAVKVKIKNFYKNGIANIKSIARLQEIKSGKLKELVKDHKLYVDGSHNPLGAKVLNEYLESLDCNKHIILGMMANKDHNEYMSFFKDISTLTTIDIPNQPNSIKGGELKDKLNGFSNINYK